MAEVYISITNINVSLEEMYLLYNFSPIAIATCQTDEFTIKIITWC
jgi:hypothetical protein